MASNLGKVPVVSVANIDKSNFAVIFIPILFACLILNAANQQLLVSYVIFFGALSFYDRRFFISAFSIYFLILEFLSVPFLYFPIFFVAIGIYLRDAFADRQRMHHLKVEGTLYFFVLLCFLSILINDSYQSFGLVVAFAMHLFIFYVITLLVVSNKANLSLIFVPVALVAAFTAITSINEADMLTGRIGMLGVSHEERSGTIGRLATVCIMGALLSLIMLFSSKKKLFSSLFLICLVCCFSALLLTQSRGQLLALLLSVVVSVLTLYRVKIFYVLRQQSVYIPIMVLMALSLAYLVYHDFDVSHLMVFKRLSSGAMDGASDIRIQIWLSALSTLDDFTHLLFGGGVNNFRSVSILGFYAHSVFVDILFSTGVLGFLCCVWLILRQVIVSIKVGSFSALSLVLLTSVNNLTHGEFNTINFWFLLFVSMAITVSIKKHEQYSERN